MKKVIQYTYYILISISAILMLAGLIWGKTDEFSRNKQMEKMQVYPEREVAVSENTHEFYIDIESPDGVSMTMELYTNRKEVEVYADEHLIYEFRMPESIFGHNSGAKFHFIEIPVQAEEIKVVIKTIHDEKWKDAPEFYVGDGLAIYRNHIKDSLPDIVLSLFCILSGAFLVGYWLVVKKKNIAERSSLYFGLFTVVLGAWTVHQTDFATIVVNNRTAASFCGFMLTMLMIVPFVLFVKSFLEAEDAHLAYGICWTAIVVTVINTAGHMMNLWRFKDTAPAIHICIAAGLLYLVYAAICRIRRYGFDHKVKTNLIGAVILIFSVIVDLSAFYMDGLKADIVGRLGLLIYIVLLGGETTLEFFKQVEEGRKAEIYKELAEKDMMTGLYNRNAFDDWEYNCKDPEDVMLATFDLNNLKQCNDTMGHEIGDKYIIDSANLIKQMYGDIATCYRIGGDEFCAVIEHAKDVDMKARLEQLKRAQDDYNAKSSDINMQIACGYASFEEADLTIQGTRSRADARMYVHKKELKKQ